MREKWTTEKIRDQKGKVVVITGSSSGIGFEAARVLADKNAEVIIAVRNRKKGNLALEKIRDNNKHADVKVMLLDLADLRSVEKFAIEFKKKYSRLDLLINNAGVMVPPYTKNFDGFELQMGTNHLGHFALTLRLLPVIVHTENSVIVNLSSMAHKFGGIDFNDLMWEKRKYKKWNAYGSSKIANLLFTNELGRLLSDRGKDVKVTAAHPGWTATDLQRYAGVTSFMNNFFAMKTEQGVLPTLRAAFDENSETGDFFGPDGLFEIRGYPVKVQMKAGAQDQSTARQLWEVSEKLTGVKFHLNM